MSLDVFTRPVTLRDIFSNTLFKRDVLKQEKKGVRALHALESFLDTDGAPYSLEDKLLRIEQYLTELGFNDIRESFLNGNAEEAFTMLVRFIKEREEELKLKVVVLDDPNIVDRVTNYSGGDNHGAIRNEHGIQEMIIDCKKRNLLKDASVLQSILKIAEQARKHLLLLDNNELISDLYADLVHEINAWMLLGAYKKEMKSTDDWHDFPARVWGERNSHFFTICHRIDSWMIGKSATLHQ